MEGAPIEAMFGRASWACWNADPTRIAIADRWCDGRSGLPQQRRKQSRRGVASLVYVTQPIREAAAACLEAVT